MKKILLVLLIPALAFMTSCGGSDDGGILSQMKKMKEVADNAKEMQEEMEANPEASEKVFSDFVLDKIDIPSSGQTITNEEWDRVQSMVDDFQGLDSTQLVNMNHDKVVEFYTSHGYESLEAGQKELEKIAQLSQFMLTWGMHFVAINQERLVNGKDAADKKLAEYVEGLKETGYTKEDLRHIEENVDLEAKAMVMLVTLQNYEQIKAITEMADSLNKIQE